MGRTMNVAVAGCFVLAGLMAVPAQTRAMPLEVLSPMVVGGGIDLVICCRGEGKGGYPWGWRRGYYGYGWRRPFVGYGYGWRRPYYGYGYGWRSW